MDNARVTEPVILTNVPVKLSDTSPQTDDEPFRDTVPLNDEPVLLVTVKNPVSGAAHFEPLVLHQVTAPLAVSLSATPLTLVTVKDVPDTTELMTNVPLFPVSVVKPVTTIVSPATRSGPLVRV